ncbi:MAG: DUF5711 family protein [Candidatus Fimenecus sp.]
MAQKSSGQNTANAKQSAKAARKKRNAKAQARSLAVLKAVCMIAVLLILVVIAAYRFGNITFSSVGDYFTALVSDTKNGDGYPYYFESTNVESVQFIGSDLFVLGDDATFVLDNTARKLGYTQHTFSNPVSYTAGGRVLLLDVGETSVRVLSKTKILYEENFPHKLLTGAIGKDGTVAIASRGENSQSMLTVYNKNHKEVFVWNCASENIVAVAVSDNGKRAAVSVIGAQNGELYCKVHLFDFSYSEPIASFAYTDTVSGLQFLSGNRLLVYGKNVFTVIDGTEKVLEEDLSLNTLSRVYTDDSRFTVAALSKYGSSASKIIKGYDRKGNVLFETELPESVKGVSCNGTYVSVLTDNFLYSYNHKGELVGKSAVDADCLQPFTDGKYTYVYAMSGIKCYKTTDFAEAVSEFTPSEISTAEPA